MPKALTATAVSNAKPHPGKRIEVSDGMTPGLRLVVQPSGVKSWAFRFERDGKGVKMTLGAAAGAGALSLAEARAQAGVVRKDLSSGVDPSERKRQAKAAEEARAREVDDLVENVVADFLKRHVDANLKSAREVRRILEREVVSKWKGRRIQDIAAKDVIRLIDGISDRGSPIAANRTLANVKKLFSWCASRDLITASPATKIKPHVSEKARDRVLSDDELRCVLAALAKTEAPWRQLFTISLLTGQRRDEVASMRWKELKLKESPPRWELKADRTKNKREHTVHLAPLVVNLLASVDEIDGCPFVFSTNGKTPVSGFSKAKAALDKRIKEARPTGSDMPPWRIHDFRRTAATGMAMGGTSVAVVEKILNHVSGTFGGIVSVYQQHDFAKQRAEGLSGWAKHVQSLMPSAAAERAR